MFSPSDRIAYSRHVKPTVSRLTLLVVSPNATPTSAASASRGHQPTRVSSSCSDAAQAGALVAALAGLGDPLVDADLGHQTFCSARRPKIPVGRMSIVTIRIPNTIRSEYFVEM